MFLSQGFASGAVLVCSIPSMLCWPFGGTSASKILIFLAEGHWERDCGVLYNFTCLQPPQNTDVVEGRFLALGRFSDVGYGWLQIYVVL